MCNLPKQSREASCQTAHIYFIILALDLNIFANTLPNDRGMPAGD